MAVKYKSFFDIDKEFTKVVREDDFVRTLDKWLNFYPHEKFVDLLKQVESVIANPNKGLSVWVEGAYGTGKSYAVLTLKKILDTTADKVEEYFTRYNLSKDLLAKYKTIKAESIVTAYRAGSASITSIRDLIVALQESIMKEARARGLKGGESSLKEAGIRWLSDPDNKVLFQAKVQKDARNRLNGRAVDSIIEELKNPKDDQTVIELIRKCDELGKESDINVFRPELNEFKTWIKDIISSNGLSAFVFIWDEFTEFFQNNLTKLTDFQEDILGLSSCGFFFIPVTHISGALFPDGSKNKIFDRFVTPLIRIELPDGIAFELIAAALKKDDSKEKRAEWNKIAAEMNDNITDARKKVGDEVKAKDETMKNILPLHPYTGLVLKYLAEKFQSNQRSMFDFIISDLGDIKAFQWFIDNMSPYDQNAEPYMTVDYLWDFFYERGKNDLPQNIKRVLDAHNRTNAKKLNGDEQIVFKTILIMIATSLSANNEKELLRPNEQNLGLAFLGTNLSGMDAINIAKRLVAQNLLYESVIAGGKKLYAVAMESVDESAIAEIKDQLKKETKTGSLVVEANLADIVKGNPPLKPSLKNRLEFYDVTAESIQRETNSVVNRTITNDAKSKNKIPVFLCFARDEKEHSALYKKIQDCKAIEIRNDGNPIIFIDMARTPMTETSWDTYLENKARAQYLSAKNDTEAKVARKIAEDELGVWKKAIMGSSLELWYSPLYPDGEVIKTLHDLMGIFETVNKNLYKYAPETWCDAHDNLYNDGNIPLGVLLGAKEEVSGTYKNPAKPIEKVIGFAWKNSKYWEQNSNAPISKIKVFVDQTIKNDIDFLAQSGIGELYRKLQDKPYGFTNCSLCAFVLGFLLKEYAENEGEYYYSDGMNDVPLSFEKIRDMGAEAIKNAITPPTRPQEKFIKAKSAEEKKFAEGTALIFGINEQSCFVGKIREHLRTKLKSYVFPIWTIKTLTDDATVQEVIDQYLGVANDKNYHSGQKNETEIVKAIGATFKDMPDIIGKLQTLITKENCQAGMKKYLSTYNGGMLVDLCRRLHFEEQYLETLKKKFEVDAANWVWAQQTADTIIDTVIAEYQVIALSQRFGIKPEKPSDISDAWRKYLSEIKVSYDAAISHNCIKGGDLFESLVKITTFSEISDIKIFLGLLETQGVDFESFIKAEKDIFEKIASLWIQDLSDDQVNDIYIRIGDGYFAKDKSEYKTIISNEVAKYVASLGRERLRKFWKDKTGTETPYKWSEHFCTPILSLVPQKDIVDARKCFATVNSNNPQDAEAETALKFLEKITWWDDLVSKEKRDEAFAKSIVGNYITILSVDRVRDLLNKHLTDGVYHWYSNDQAQAKIKELAQNEYDTKAIGEALSIVDKISDAKVKEYLKRLIKLNMTVGIEIIADNKGE